MVGKITSKIGNHAKFARFSETIFITAQKKYSILIVFLMIFSVSNAQLIPVLTPDGGVNIDGKLTAGLISGDWVPNYNTITNSYNPDLNNYIFNTDGTAVNPATTRLFRDSYNDRYDNIFQSTKVQENPAIWKRTTSEIQNKSDIHNAFYHIATDITGQDWLFVGSDRLGTTGTGYIDFEFFQKPVYEDPDNANKFVTEGLDGGRTVNDILLSISYDNGGNSPTVDVYIWLPDGSGGFNYVKQAVNSLEAYGATNASEVKVPFGAFGTLNYQPYQFVEAAINMTAIMSKVVTNGPCIGVTVESLIVKTKSASELTADAKDYIGPKPVDLVFGGAKIEYNPLVVCNYYDKVLPDFSGVEGGIFSANSPDLKINEETGEINVQKSTPGDYIITYSFISYGCPKTVTAPFTVVPVPAEKPTITSVTQPSCESTTGQLRVENPDSELTYFIRDEDAANPEVAGSNGEFTNIEPGKYHLYSKTSYGCVSDTESFEIKAFTDGEDPAFNTISDNIKKENDPKNCAALIEVIDVEFSDNCPGTTLSWTLVNDADKVLIAQGTGQFGTYNFPVGKSVLEYTLTDKAGNTKTDKLNIEVVDTEIPVISSENIEQNAEPDSCQAIINMPSVAATDNCEIKELKGTRHDGQALSAPYPVGTTTITWEAEDIHGNKADPVDQIIEVIATKPEDIVTNKTICSGETFTWNGVDYTTNQTGTRVAGANECTADQVLNLTVTPKPETVTTTETICSGESYIWSANGETYTTDQNITINNDGCTADQVLNLTVTPKPETVTTTETICSGESYTWAANNETYTTDQNITINNDGCTADQVLNLTVTPKPETVTTTETICSGESYTWSANGETYTSDQNITINNDGCTADQVLNLTVTPKPETVTTTETICSGESYTWAANNETYTTDQNITINNDGCTADQVLNLTVTPKPETVTTTETICSGESYTWSANGETYTSDQNITINNDGCTADQVLNLTVTPKPETVTTTETICSGESYTWSANGETYTSDQNITINNDGCTADQVLNLTVTPKPETVTTTETICSGESYTWSANGETYTSDQNITINNDGCTADQVLNLTVTPKPETVTTTETICSGESYTWAANNETYTTDQNITINNDGCTADQVLNLTVTPKPETVTTTETICSGESYTWSANGETYTSDQNITINNDGCTADQVLNLTVTPKPETVTTTETICSGESYTWAANNETYTTDQNITINNDGCTADQVLNLTVTPKPETVTTTETICSGESYTWSANGETYTSDQNITINNDGCTADQVLNLTVTPKPETVTTTETICSGESYTWAANNETYTTDQNITINNDGCTADQVLNLTVTPKPETVTTTETICSGESYTWAANNETYTTDQNITINNDGCTADQVLNLTVTPKPETVTTTETICSGESYIWSANGETYTTDQNITISNDGCTADQVLNLTVTPKPETVTTTETICSGESYTWSANGETYTSDQNITINNDGCTADQVLNLTVTPKPEDIITNATIYSNETYTWLANGETYSTNQSGLKLVNDGCTADEILNLTVKYIPVANNDLTSTTEDNPVTITVLGNDTDLDGDELTVVSVTQPENGSVVINQDGTVTYTPDPNFVGEDEFTYTIEDEDGLNDTATVTVTVNPVNDAPIANDDSAETDEDTEVVIAVLDNDTDLDGDELTVVSVTQPENGSVVINQDGTVTYTPDPNFVGEDEFTYTIEDEDGLNDTATVTVTVNPVNDAPIANDDSAETDEDTEVVIAVLDNDTDLDGDELTVVSVTQPENGSVVINQDGTVTYTPDPNFVGEDEFTYTIEDEDGLNDTATVTVTVNPVNDAPVANDDSAETDEDTEVVIAVLDNDTDLDGDELTVVSVTQPENGSVVINQDGTVTYTPDPNFVGEDEFTYTIEDQDGLNDTATVTVTVNPVNDAPIANDDSAETDEDTEVVIAVLDNDTDLDGDELTVVSVTQPENGSVVINQDGTVTYTPDPNFVGEDEFTYTIEDEDGLNDTATVTVTVNPVNDAPVANDDSAETDEDTEVVIAVLDNDTDLDGDELTVVSVTQPENGSVVINQDGTVTYTPDPNFVGEDEFTYTIEDQDGLNDTATVTVTVNPVNDAPIANDDSAETNEDTEVVIAVLDNDTDLDGDELTVVSVTQPENGSVVINQDGTVTYTPDPDFVGEDEFTYTIEDEDGLNDTATVTVTVNPVNDAPIANDDSAETNEDTEVVIAVLDNDTDLDGDELTVVSVTQPENGSVVINQDGTVTYTPDPNFVGEDEFTYTIEDEDGLNDTATVTVTVNPVNDAPVANDDSAETDEDTEVVIAVLDNDTDLDGDELTVVSVTQPENGSVVINQDGTVTYTPDPNFVGEDEFTYTIEDQDGLNDTATVTVTVNPVNDAPIANDDSAETNEDTEVVIAVLDNDTDLDGDELTVVSVTQPENGSVVINQDGTVTYTPDPNFVGEDEFTYTIEDEDGLNDTATVTVTVNPVNDAPIANDDSAETDEDTEVVIAVLDNDTDLDGDELTVVSVTQPENGSVVINQDGTVTYTPDPNFVGEDEFTYTIEDEDGLTDTATVTVTVNPVNDAPVANDDSAETDEDTEVVIAVLDNDTDLDGDELTVVSVTQPENGSVVINQDGTVTYTPDPDFVGEDEFTYTIEDEDGLNDTATVTVTVNPVNDAPVANDDSAETDEDTEVVIAVLDNDTDLDGDELTVVSVTQPENGSVVINQDGTVTYTPDPNFVGEDEFTYTIEDQDGLNDTATVTVTVNPVNDAPIANDDSAETNEDTEVVIAVLDNDTDLDGDELTVVSVTQPENGSVVINQDGTVTYTPDPNFVGEDEFTYTIEDEDGLNDTATVTVTVNPVNDAPIANDDSAETDEDTEVVIAVLDNDTDLDGDELTVVSVTQPENGSVVINQDGTVTYTPDPDFVGEDEFTYTIEDEDGLNDTATVTVTVNPVNDAPIANDDSAETNEDTEVVIAVLDNDTDLDGDELTVVSVTQPENGSVVINQDGTVTYTPDPNFVGEDEFTYTIEDEDGLTDTATVTVTVNPVNDAPVANDDSAETDEDTEVVIAVLDNDTDLDGDELTVVSVTQPENGSVVINQDGTVTYTPDPNFVGEDEFTYTIEDEDGLNDTATVTVTVNPVNDAPVANDDSAETDQDVPVEITVLENDSDVDGDDLKVISVTDPENGSVMINEDGTVTYSPDDSFTGEDSFEYTISDSNGGTDTAIVTVNVNDTEGPEISCPNNMNLNNDPGVCGAIVAFTIPEFTDNSGSATIEQTAGPAPGELFPVGITTITFVATDGSGNSTICSFDVIVIDNEAPVLEEIADITMDNDDGVCGAIVNFESVKSTDNCEIGTIAITEGLESGTEFPIGTTTVTYTVADINGNISTESFTVTVNDNEAPVISCPVSKIVSTETGESYAIVNFDNATATDNCEVSVEQTGGPVSGSQFPIGTTTVTFTATDASGNSTECSFTVTVEDNEDPSLECPSDIDEGVDGGVCGAIVEFETPAGFDNSGDVTVTQTSGPASGEQFPVGVTTVEFTATDAAGNSATCSFTVTIADDEAPQISDMDDITVNNDSGVCGAVVNFEDATATDNCAVESIVITEGLISGSEFPVGETIVTYTATDTAGLTATTSFTVTVVDNEAPSIECPESFTVNVEFGTTSTIVTYDALTITDNCGETTTIMTSGITSGEEFPVGETVISYTVTDSNGNEATCQFTVTVEEDPAPAPPAAPTVEVTPATCSEPTGTITVDTQEGISYSIDGENYQTEGVFTNLTPGTYDVVAQDEFGQLSNLTTVVIEEPVAQEITTVQGESICDDQGEYDLFDLLTGDYDESGTWIDTDNSGALNGNILDPSVPAPGFYTFEYEIEGNCPSITTVTLEIDDCIVLQCSVQDVRDSISKAVTPNGDNKNDFFTVDLDTGCGFTYDVKIFNRWGAKVFDAQNYQNNWDGYSDSSFTSSNQLPSGTYFYVLEIREGNFEPIQGYIYLGTK